MSKVYLSLDGKRIKVAFPYVPSWVSAVKKVNGARFVPQDKGGPHWTVPLDIDSAHQLRKAFGDDLLVGSDVREWAKVEMARAKELAVLSTVHDSDLTRLHLEAPGMASTLRPFQRSGIRFGAVSPHPLIADQPGLGKTREAIGSILEAGLPGPFLVLAPKTSLRTVWEDHILNVLDRDDMVYVATGTKQQRADVLADMEAYIEAGSTRVWLIANPEMVRTVKRCPICREGIMQLKSHLEKTHDKSELDARIAVSVAEEVPVWSTLGNTRWSAVIVDECHRGAIRNPKTNTAKAMYKLKADKRIALSGTPMKNRPLDLWGTLHWLNPDQFTSKWRWADRYLHVRHNGYGKEFCAGVDKEGADCSTCTGGILNHAMQDFNDHLTPYMLRRTKAEVLPELPPKEYVSLWCDMDPAQAKQYNQFADLAEIMIRDETVSATNVLAEITRLKQFATAAQEIQYDDDDNFTLIPDLSKSGKMEALMDLLEERGILDGDGDEKVVVFSQWSRVVDAIEDKLERMGISTLKITGKVKDAVRKQSQDMFQSEGGPRVMLMTTTAGGVAITLDRADSVVFMDETWSPADMEQAEDRVHRVSRLHNVTIYRLRTNGTVDWTIAKIVESKQTVSQMVMDDRRQLKLR